MQVRATPDRNIGFRFKHVDTASAKSPLRVLAYLFFRDKFFFAKNVPAYFFLSTCHAAITPHFWSHLFKHTHIDSLTRVNAMYASMCLEHLIVSKRGSVYSVSLCFFFFSPIVSFQYRHVDARRRLLGACRLNVP